MPEDALLMEQFVCTNMIHCEEYTVELLCDELLHVTLHACTVDC